MFAIWTKIFAMFDQNLHNLDQNLSNFHIFFAIWLKSLRFLTNILAILSKIFTISSAITTEFFTISNEFKQNNHQKSKAKKRRCFGNKPSPPHQVNFPPMAIIKSSSCFRLFCTNKLKNSWYYRPVIPRTNFPLKLYLYIGALFLLLYPII